MSDDDQPEAEIEIEVIQPTPGVIEIDGNVIGNIILRECHTTATRSRVAANRILEYLGGLLVDPHKAQ